MIHLGESQVFEGKMAQAFDGVVGRHLAGANLLQELANEFGIQAALSRRATAAQQLLCLKLKPEQGEVILAAPGHPSKKSVHGGISRYILPTTDSLAWRRPWPVCQSIHLNPITGENNPTLPLQKTEMRPPCSRRLRATRLRRMQHRHRMRLR
jgi:hypothetical protein